MNTMERAAFYDAMGPGPNRLKGFQLVFSGAPGDAAGRIRESAVTGGTFSGLSIPEIDTWMKQYDASTDMQERKRLIEQVQKFTLDQYLMIPVCRNVAIWGFGQRLEQQDWRTSTGSIPQYNFLGPYEDMTVKD